MAETTNIGLHQWAAEDPVLRTDFNADFAKIDRAVGAIPLTKLKEVVTTQDAQQLDVDVSDIDFDLYDEVIVYAELVNTKDDSNVSPYCSIRINGDDASNYRYASSGDDHMTSSANMSNNNYICYPGMLTDGTEYVSYPTRLRFHKSRNCLFLFAEYAYVRLSSYTFYSSTASGAYLLQDVPVSTLNIAVGNVSNNSIKAGSKLFFLGVKR